MAVNMRLLGWEAVGLRSPDHRIDLESDAAVTLIQMPNGMGKTTTLQLLRATLSGEAHDWTASDVLALARPGALRTTGQFIVRLDVNGTKLTLELTLNYKAGTAQYRTTFGRGVEKGYSPPPSLTRYFKPEFVNLFIFDGELASQLLDEKKTKAREATDTVFQVSILDILRNEFEQYWDAKAKNSVREEKGRTQRANKVDTLKKRLRTLEKQARNLRATHSNLSAQAQAMRAEYDDALRRGKHVKERLDKLTSDIASARDDVAAASRGSFQLLRDPYALSARFGNELKTLKSSLDQLRLPRSTSREFFVELGDMPTCLCGTPIGPDEKAAILASAERFLDKDEVGVLNNVKSDIADYLSSPSEEYPRVLESKLHELAAAVKKRGALETEWRAVEQERLEAGGEELQKMHDNLQDFERQLDKCSRELELLDSPGSDDDDETSESLLSIRRQLKVAEELLAQATNTLNLKMKTGIVKDVLEKAAENARGVLREELVQDTNNRIVQLLKMTPISLDDIGDHLVLRNQKGASVGQTLSVSYAFLTSLFDRGKQHLPFVVDSPAGSLDNTTRTEVARMIPSLSRQFVAFMISSERGHFVTPLHKATNGCVQYLTVFRKKSITPSIRKALDAVKKAQMIENDDSFVVAGQAFFEAFDVVEEV